MALDTAIFAVDVRDRAGTGDDEFTSSQMTKLVEEALREYSRYRRKTQNITVSVLAGVDRYACSVPALGVIAHSYHHGSYSGVPVITGWETLASSTTHPTAIGDLKEASLAMDLLLDQYESGLLREATNPVTLVSLEGGQLVFAPPPTSSETVYVRLKVPFTTSDFPNDLDAYDAIVAVGAWLALKRIYAKRIIFSGLSVGPKNVKLGSPEDLRKLAQDCRDDFLRLVGYFSVGRH